MKNLCLLAFLFFLSGFCFAQRAVEFAKFPLQMNAVHSLSAAWKKKPVLWTKKITSRLPVRKPSKPYLAAVIADTHPLWRTELAGTDSILTK